MSRIAEFQYVENMFNDCIALKEKHKFRDKLEHTKRVYIWANRLLESEEADKEVLLTAVIFHDVGYTYSDREHPKYSAEICKEYLKNNNYNEEFIEKVTDIIANHGNKELLFSQSTSKEQILLIEADCLDESGALSVLRDALSEGSSSDASYYKTYERLCQRSIVRKPDNFYCITDTAKKIWREKQEIYMKFLNSMRNDLVGFDELMADNDLGL